jgi:hypothetical protein
VDNFVDKLGKLRRAPVDTTFQPVDNPVDYFFHPGLTRPGEEFLLERLHMSP